MTKRCVSLACLSLLVAACGRPALTGAAMKADDVARAMAVARADGEAEVKGWKTPALAAADVGLDPLEFVALDRDGDGKLGPTEQLALYRMVWDQMSGMAQGQVQGMLPQAPTSGADYHPPYNLAYTPTRAELFVDAEEILPAVLQTLQGAQRTIRLDLFMLGGSQGQKLAELLVAKFKAGVDVRILHDPGFGLAGEPRQQIAPVMRYLQAQGIRVKPYPLQDLPRRHGHPLANVTQIDHDKWLVVDEQVAMVGSMNLIDVGVMNHDAYFRLTGGVAQELAATHDQTWQLAGPALPDFGKPAPAARFQLAEAADGQARILKTDIDQQTTRQALLDAIAAAKKSVHVLIFEFGDQDVARALVAAEKRGVEVRVIADPNASYDKYFPAFKTIKLHGTPNLVTTDILREGGVPVKWYIPQAPHQEMHMKAAVIDHERVILGSTNFTYQAFHTFRETSADVVSPSAAAKWEQVFEKDWEAHSRPVQKHTFFEKVIAVAVKAFDKVNLSWW